MIINCLNCSKETKNPKFCCRSCAAKFNNVLVPKRKKKTKYCISCQKNEVIGYQNCEECKLAKKIRTRVRKELSPIRKQQRLDALRGYSVEYRNKKKLQAVTYKGGKCEICGYDKCIRALEFHHLDSNEKDFNISSSQGDKRWNNQDFKAELDKCILVCSNCHREIHYEKKVEKFNIKLELL